ncbi:MAG: PatB family C-S lyase [Clostridia bacterium]|nr:PatB family C-S lyase [Clostridia bacterium]
MKHDFTSIPDRSRFGSAKWEIAKNASTEFVPLSVADMEFPTAKPIVDDIKKLAEEAILGYTNPTQEYYDAVISWMKRRHDFEIKKEWLLQTPGIINALSMLIETVTAPGDGVIVMPPVYYPFDMTITATGRRSIFCPLINNGGKYEIDFALLEEKAKDGKNTAILFCNPHNPAGRVWTEEELRKTAEICCKNNVFIIDDEIHNDLIMPGYKHTVMANINDETKNNIAVCTAPSKTFNLAGVQCSNIIIPNDEIKAKAMIRNKMNMQMHLNVFAYTICTSAYNKCEDWLDELIGVIAENAKCVENFMAENFPEIKVYPLEGTYLQWLDMRSLGLTHLEIRKMLEDANIYLDNGEMFGILGRGFQRINLACAKSTLEKMLERFKNAVEKARTKDKEYHKALEIGDSFDEINAEKNTLVIFGRRADCKLTKNMLDELKEKYSDFASANFDIKFIVPSDGINGNYPFEIIADPEANLYKKYNVFEADSAVYAVAGDKLFEEKVGSDTVKIMESKVFASADETAFRPLQLFAFVGVDKDKKVVYSYYSKTVGDIPDLDKIINNLKV